MNVIATVEWDVIPNYCETSSTDFAGVLPTRQISKLLIEQTEGNDITAKLVSRVTRQDDYIWRLQIAPTAFRSTGHTVTPEEIITQFKRLSLTRPLMSVLAPFSNIAKIGHSELELTTRYPIDVRKPLANPLLTPDPKQCGTVTTGRYKIGERDPNFLLLRSHIEQDAIQCLEPSSAEQGQTLYDKGVTDITCSTTYPLARLQDNTSLDTNNDLQQQRVCLSFNLLAPPGWPKDIVELLGRIIDRDLIARDLKGLIVPIYSSIDQWIDDSYPLNNTWMSGGKTTVNDIASYLDGVTLTYPDYSPNKELADLIALHISTELGVYIPICPVSYVAYLKQADTRNQLRLAIAWVPWDSPLSVILPILSLLDNKEKVAPIEQIDALGAFSSEDPWVLRNISTCLDVCTKTIPIAQMVYVTRSRFGPIHIPRSGLIDYHSAIRPNKGPAREDTDARVW